MAKGFFIVSDIDFDTEEGVTIRDIQCPRCSNVGQVANVDQDDDPIVAAIGDDLRCLQCELLFTLTEEELV